MSLYNVEIFDRNFYYKDSYQIADMSYEFDYLSLRNSKIKIPRIKAGRNDFIRIKKEQFVFVGIIEGVSEADTSITIEYKHFLNMFDVNTYIDADAFNASNVHLEAFVANMIKRLYVQNEDTIQNVTGLNLKVTSRTAFPKNANQLSVDENIINLYGLLKKMLIKHGIRAVVDIDVQNKAIVLQIGKSTLAKEYVIEADLPNVLDKKFIIKNGEEALNKLVIYNQDDYSESKTYYKGLDGTISSEMNDSNRIVPVIFDTIDISVKEDETFDDVSLRTANEKMTVDYLDNLIEITVLSDDVLVKPHELQIGDKVKIIHNGLEYHTMLTGMEVKQNRIKLIFGAIRIDFTKMIKRRLTNG